MRVVLVTLCVSFLVVIVTPNIDIQVGNWQWGFFDVPSSYYVFDEASYIGGSGDAFDGFFYLFLDPLGTVSPQYGGVKSSDLIYTEQSGEFKVFKRRSPSTYLGAQITTTARLDAGSVGWGTVFREFHNPGSTPISLFLNSLYKGNAGDNRGSDLDTTFIATSDGDVIFTQADSWAVSYQRRGKDPVMITAFGEAGLLDYLRETNGDDNVHWSHTIAISPGETVGFLQAVGLVNYYLESTGLTIPAALVTARNAANAVGSAHSFFTYINPLGNRLLSHLSAQQLRSVVNWDFVIAGVGGDPHGVHFDGTLFELPKTRAFYCLFADDRYQVNIEVGHWNLITQVVVISHLHGIQVSATINGLDIRYAVDDRRIGVPEKFELVETREAPFYFGSDPLNQLERYHQSALMIRDLVTIVGGVHNRAGGFFNVAVHSKPNHWNNPTILQLPLHPLREVGFSAAVIPSIDFTP